MTIKCEAEVGSPVLGWRLCGRKAVIAVERETHGGIPVHTLHFCDRHLTRQELDHVGSKLFRNGSVWTITEIEEAK